MEISQESARDSLDTVRAQQLRIRRSVASAGSSVLLMMWGLIWAAAYIATQFCIPDRIESIWLVWTALCGGGVLATFVLGWLQFRSGRPTKTPAEKKLGQRVFWFWSFLYLFAFIWMSLVKPLSGIQYNAFMVTVIMFAFVVSGLWTDGAYMTWLGLFVTTVTLVGYFAIPLKYYNIWMAPMAGGSLFVTGLYLRLRWR